MRSMEGTPVFYLEDNMSLTQEGLDMMVDTGAWTEETIEAMGGREALLSNNIASDQIQIYQLKMEKFMCIPEIIRMMRRKIWYWTPSR